MVVDFSKLDLQEQPVLILKNTAGVPIGTLGSAMNITADIKYNEASVLEFEVPAQVDGVDTPHYDSVIGMRIIELHDIGQFILINPKEVGDGVKKIKYCKAYSLEYEFTFKKLSLASSTYNFWNPVTPDSTLMQIILELMPSWSLGYIDSELVGKYRTFEVSDENLYNFIKGTIQESYNCIFDFDTMTRRINVKSAKSTVPTNPIYISNANLAKEITVEENTESIVTRLDVNGADGVNIRDVNPSGTNQIINLDYFMNTDNFDQVLIDKYYAWKESYANYQLPYYNLSVEYVLQIMRKTTEQTALVELESERTILENEQAIIIQGIARDLVPQSKLDDVNTRIAAKQAEINAKNEEIKGIEAQAASIYSELVTINKAANFKSYFTQEEYLQLDRYLKDDAVSESSFVAQTTGSYTDEDTGNHIADKLIGVSDASITYVTNTRNKEIYDVKGGRIKTDFIDAEVISAAFEKAPNNSFVMTAYLGAGTTGDRSFPKGCISLTGTVSSVAHDMAADAEIPDLLVGTRLDITVSEGYLYFTLNTSEYEKRAVAWDLFEYGNEILTKVSQPSYTFGVTSANFLCLDDFVKFKNKLRHGEKLYVGISEDETLAPICVGVKVNFDSPNDLTLEFSDTYTSGDSSFLLADLLEQSVSMGKSVDLNKYTYSAFMDSGASTKVKDFMKTALDVSKNAIMSSKEQAISWGDSGIRLRKWSDDAHTEYEPKQVWLNNNSILMTSNNWSTAELAIGNFYDKNLGDCWGIVAPNIVGTLLAGENLVIESTKEDGGVAVFKVDAEGCALHNSTISVTSDSKKSHILLDPDNGFLIGKYPLIKTDGTIDDTKKLFYADTDGNLTLKGTIYASAGEFIGKITALSGYIGNGVDGWTIDDSAIWNGRDSLLNPTTGHANGTYIGTDGIYLGKTESGTETYVRMNSNGYLVANNANITGVITAKTGYIGNGTATQWTIGNSDSDPSVSCIYSGKTFLGSTSAGIYLGTDGVSISSGLSYSYTVVNTKPDNWESVYTSYYTRSGKSGSYVYTPVPVGSSAPTWKTNTFYSCTSDSPYVMISNNGVLTAHDANIIGHINATSGLIGGCSIENGVLQIRKANITEKLTANEIDVDNLTVGAAVTVTGVITAEHIDSTGLHVQGANIDNLTVTNAQIDSLDANKLTVNGKSIGSNTGTGYLDNVYSKSLVMTSGSSEGYYTATLSATGVTISSPHGVSVDRAWADIGNNVFTSITLGGVTRTSWPTAATAVFG